MPGIRLVKPLRNKNAALLIADPGLQRTTLAGRVTLSVLLAVLVAGLVARLAHQPGTFIMLAAVTAMQTSLVVFGPAGPLRPRAPLYAWLTAAAAIALAVAVSPWAAARYAAFVLVMVVAVWVRRFKPYGFGLGMTAFNAFFFPVFIRAVPSQYGWLLVHLTVGVLSATFIRGVLLPHRPRATLRHLLIALYARAREVRQSGDVSELRELVRDVDEIVLQMHDLLAEDRTLVKDEQQFQADLFAVESLCQLYMLQQRRDQFSRRVVLAPEDVDPAERLEVRLNALDEAFAQGRSLLSHQPSAREEPPPEPRNGLRDTDRTAVQVAIATTLSIAVGAMLSEQRWYWAAMTAFLMFANAANRGAALRRAVERTAGTAAGIGAGLLIAYLVADKPVLTVALLFPALFAAFWMLKSSYAVMTVMITVMLALMYEMMGMLTPDLLLLRLGETGIGAGLAVATAYVVLPTRTRDTLDKAYSEFFDAVDDFLAALPRMARNEAPGVSLDVVRRMSRAVAGLETASRPIMNAVPGRRARQLRNQLVLALAIRYALHRLLARIVFHTVPVDAESLDRSVAQVRTRLANGRAGEAAEDTLPVIPETAETAALAEIDALLQKLSEMTTSPTDNLS